MEYFGKLNRDMFETEATSQQDEILLSLDYFDALIKTSEIPVTRELYNGVKVQTKQEVRPCKLLLEEFYDFLLMRYIHYINNPFSHFFNDFNNDVYGLSSPDARNKALEQFNAHFKNIKVEGMDVQNRTVSDNGIENIYPQPKLEYLWNRRQGLKQYVGKRDFILEYLYGNMDFFDHQLMNDDQTINDFVFFEYNLKIILSLNDRFSFEVDTFFSKAAQLKPVFDKYIRIFKSLEPFIRVHLTIESFKENISTEVDCLYHALSVLNLVQGSKSDFSKYLLNEHQISKRNIRKLDLETQPENQKRVDIFMKIFREFAS
ncbi:hypothetical protein GCM10022271_11570 [Corallibacter vietnamensis]|uniref:RteC protein n=1 Tax=Corallibacter vietnamensis TaxID=904130 RepID=A0ABP7H3C1_9FLAO